MEAGFGERSLTQLADDPPGIRQRYRPVCFVSSTDLHVCATCGADLVHPLACRQTGPSHCQLTLRCPNCERVRIGVFAQADVDRLDAALARATAMLTDALARVATELQDDLDRFVAAQPPSSSNRDGP